MNIKKKSAKVSTLTLFTNRLYCENKTQEINTKQHTIRSISDSESKSTKEGDCDPESKSRRKKDRLHEEEKELTEEKGGSESAKGIFNWYHVRMVKSKLTFISVRELFIYNHVQVQNG